MLSVSASIVFASICLRLLLNCEPRRSGRGERTPFEPDLIGEDPPFVLDVQFRFRDGAERPVMAHNLLIRRLIQNGLSSRRIAHASGVNHWGADNREVAGDPHKANISVVNADSQSNVCQNRGK